MSKSDSLKQFMNKSGSSAEKMRAAVSLAGTCIPDNMDSALILLDFAAPLLEGRHDLYKAEYLNQRGVFYWYRGEFEQAIQWFKKTLRLPENKKLLQQFAAASNNTGTLYRFLGSPDSARVYLEKALKIDETRKNKQGMAKTLYDLAALHRQTSQYELALDYILRAADFVRQSNDTSMMVHVYMALGNIYTEIDSTGLAIRSFEKAIKSAEEAGIKGMVGTGHTNLCALYCANPSQFSATYNHYVQGMEIASALSDYKLMMSLNLNMGNGWEARKQFEKAMVFYQKARSLLPYSKEPIRTADLYFAMGHAFNELNMYDSARVYLKLCLQTAERIQSLKHQSNVLLELAEIDSSSGNIRQAYLLYRQGIALRDSLWSNQHRSRIAELQLIHEAQEDKIQIKELERRQKLNHAIFFLTILTSLFGFISSAAIILFLRKKHLAARQVLVIREKENEIAKTDLENKRKELMDKAHTIVAFEEMISRLEAEIQKMEEGTSEQNVETLNSVLKLVNKNAGSSDTWKEFLKHFDELNDEFITKITGRFPELSPIEVRLCAFLRLNMSTKEIAEITKRAVRTVEFYRTSIRKKIGLRNNENLASFLAGL